LIRLIKSTNSKWPQAPSEQRSGKVIKDPVHSSGISGTRKGLFKTVTFKKTCNSRKACKTLD